MSEPAMKPLNDADSRLRALTPDQSFIVQAPAGSGKTELLTQRYLRLLSTVEQPEQILAITFTRKAASEMRNRILQSLARARATTRPSKAHEAQTWDLAQAALAADQRHGWQLETHPSRLRIQTIDSLNAGLSRRLPMLAGTGAAMDIAQDTQPIYEAVCERLLQRLGNEGEESACVETVLMHLANRVPDFVAMICELLARRDQWLPLVVEHRNDQALRASMEGTLSEVIEHHLSALREAIPIDSCAELTRLWAYAANNKLRAETPPVNADILRSIASLTDLPPCSVEALELWRELANHLCTTKGEFRKTVTVKDGFPPKEAAKQDMLGLLTRLCDYPALLAMLNGLLTLPAARFSDVQWKVLAALLSLLPKAVGELMLEFQARGQVDYVELSLRALRALGTPEQPTDTALAMDERLQHILVDEFQDTSYTQMALLRLLTGGWSEGDGRSLFCVGDPMQSIYRFRQAEVGLFIDLQHHGLPNVKLEPLRLRTNFRSTQPIVEWVNRDFPSILPARDDSELGAVRYSPSDTRPDAQREGHVQVHAGIEQSAEEEAQQIAQIVKTTLAASSRTKVAILVGGRSHVGPIADELKRMGVEFAAVDIERLQDRPLVQDLISLTRALLHLGDRTAWLACLRAPWCGLSLSDLHAIAAEDHRQTIWTLLNDKNVRQQLSVEGLGRITRFNAILAAALQERSRYTLRDWVERCWLTLGGAAVLRVEGDLDDAEAFFARLSQLEVAGDLEDITRLENQLSELYATPRAAESTRVEIMTVHKSKGLEFDVVILPSLHRTVGRDDKKLLRWARIAGLEADGLVLAPPNEKGADNDSIYQWLSELEKQRTHYERGRLLYVAATRAKRELHLFGSVRMGADKSDIAKPRAGSLLYLLWPHVEAEFLKAAEGHQDALSFNAPSQTVTLKRLPVDWIPPRPESSAAALPIRAVVNAEFERPEFDWVSEASRHVGTVVHAELERLVKLPVDQMQAWNAIERRETLLLHLAELGVPQALRKVACERVVKAIEHTLSDSRGRWILGLDAEHAQATSELALSGVVNGSVVNIVIDRSFVDQQGTRWIIDFKTSSHEGGGLEEFLTSEELRYRGQLERYAKLMHAFQPDQPIKTALYFPLMGVWRELS